MHFRTMNFFRISIPVLITIITTLFATAWVFAQETARVYVQPVESADGILTVDVLAEDVTDMYGAEFRLTYDPAVLSVQDVNANQEGIQIAPGTLLSPDQGFIVANEANEAEGTIIFAMTLLNPAPAVSGTGPLARVTFNVLQPGPSTIAVEKAKLVSVDLQTIPSQIESLAIGQNEQANEPAQPAVANSQEQEQAPAPVVEQAPAVEAPVAAVEAPPGSPASESDFPWWIVAAGVMVIGIIALGGFIVMGGLNASPTPVTTQPVAKPGGSGTGSAAPRRTRPSAFKN